MSTATRYKPRATVVVHTEEQELVFRGTNDPNTPADNDVLTIDTSRDMGADAPTFSINLVSRQHWDRWISSNDLVEIRMSRPPEANNRVLIGLVDDSRRRTVMSSNGPQRVITVTGRAIAKAFIRFEIGVVPEAEYASHIAGWIQDRGINIAGSTAKEIVKSIMDEIAKEYIDYKWSNGNDLFAHVRTDLTDLPNLVLADDSNIVKWQNSMWALFKEVYEAPFYECFWEVKNGIETLIGRPTPFDKSDWEDLPQTTITDVDVISDDTGHSDVETYTLFSVGAKSLFAPHDTYKTLGVLPYWHEPYADKYGIHRLHVETAYIAIADSGDAEGGTGDSEPQLEDFLDDDGNVSLELGFLRTRGVGNMVGTANFNMFAPRFGRQIKSTADIMEDLQRMLYDWNVINNSFRNGTITVKGSNKFKVGTRLVYDSTADGVRREYYVTSVAQRFVNFSSWNTTLGVTRGLSTNRDRFAEPVGQSEEYSGMGLVPFDPEGSRSLMEQEDSEYHQMLENQGAGGGGGYSSADGQAVVEGAKAVMRSGHVRYVFGGNTRTQQDCSSFTQRIYNEHANMDIGRTTGDQVRKGTKLTDNLNDAVSTAQAGDLFFFKNTYVSSHIHGVSHVGIAVGDGTMIHNSGSKSVAIDDMRISPYWRRHFLMLRRVLVSSESNVAGGTSGGHATATDIATQMPSTFKHSKLGGRLAGTGQVFIDAGKAEGVNYVMLAAIAMHETGNGTSNAIRNRNNTGGFMRSSGGLMEFRSINDSIRYHADMMRRLYVSQGLTSLTAIHARYAPVGAANDPTGLNNNWVRGIIKFYNQLT